MASKRGGDPPDDGDSSKIKRPRTVDVSAEVAEDFREYLSELTGPERFSIETLTAVAKSSIEHARVISDTLRTHIKTSPPRMKLPAFYVLDSIAKNVGTPYTLFLSQNLYNLFLDAYTLVDAGVRRQMENMLKTWKVPPEGSSDGRPVFPIETTRSIETALIRARTAYLEQQNLHNRARPGVNVVPQHPVGDRPSSTNPAPASASSTPLNQYQQPRQEQHQQQQGQQQRQLPHHQVQQPPQQNGAPETTFQYGMPAVGAGTGYQGQNSQPATAPGYLQAGVYQQQQLQPRINSPIPGYQMGYAPPPSVPPQSAYPPYQTQSPAQGQDLTAALQSLSSVFQHQQHGGTAASSQQPNLAALLGLANPTPQQPQPPHYQTPTPQPVPALPPGVSQAQLMELSELLKLSQKALTPTQPYTAFPPPLLAPPASVASALQNVNGGFPSAPVLPAPAPSSGTAKAEPVNDVVLKAASLKVPRPHLIVSTLCQPIPSKVTQCTTCGRRFSVKDDGPAAKARHLDAHFRTNMRLSAAPSVQRSWYLDEHEWIAYREVDDSEPPPPEPAGAGGAALAAVVAAKASSGVGGRSTLPGKQDVAKPPKHMLAPVDPVLKRTPCPICQELFETIWSDPLQEWIWEDAVEVDEGNAVEGGRKRIFHESCLEMMAGDAKK